MAVESPKLSVREKLAYGLGDSAANLIGAAQATFLLFFYTDVLGISAKAAGAILLWSRIVDAFNDPIVGALSDRTETRWGRYRPWLLATAVPLAVALVLCYSSPDLSPTGKLIWAVLTYNALMIMYAANNIPYCALSGVMTGDTNERTNLASWRFVCAMSATLLVTMFTLDLVKLLGGIDERAGYQRTMIVWGALAIACLVTTFVFTRERVQPVARERTSVRQDLLDLLRNGPWVALFVLAALICVQHAFRGGSMLFYFQHFQTSPQLLTWVNNFGLFNGFGLVVVMVGVFASNPLSKRFGKRNVFQVFLLLSAAAMASVALLPRDSLAALFAVQALIQLAFGPTIPLLWAMMADVADYAEWKTGRRSTALAFASVVLGLKLGFGVGGWLNGDILARANYVADGELPESALLAIRNLVSIYPAIVLVAGAVVLFFYRIDRRMEHEIESSLHSRRVEVGQTEG
jgi:GPH family glycoside/pentoside/hexuronide:cation symporter